MTSYTITLPIPDKSLNPNARVHWQVKRRATKAQREAARLRMQVKLGVAQRPRWETATAQVHWFAKTLRFPDKDNAQSSLKAAFDGIVDSGLLSDDKDLTHLPMTITKDAKNPRVEITISHF